MSLADTRRRLKDRFQATLMAPIVCFISALFLIGCCIVAVRNTGAIVPGIALAICIPGLLIAFGIFLSVYSYEKWTALREFDASHPRR